MRKKSRCGGRSEGGASKALILLIVGILMCITACSSRSSGPPKIRVISIPNINTYLLPLDAYEPSDEERNIIGKATLHLESKCALRYGFGSLEAAVGPMTASPAGPNARRYGVSVLSQVEVYGYHSPAQLAASKGSGEPTLSDAEVAVLNGAGQATYDGMAVPPGGCIGVANRTLSAGGPNVSSPDLNQSLDQVANNQSIADSRVQATFANWSACMARFGFNYTDPIAAIKDPAFTGAEPTSTEVATATADVKCKQATNMLAIWGAVETAYQERLIKQNATPLNAIRQAYKNQLRNAESNQ